MGAWGPGSFDNDDAADWIWELGDCGDWRLVRSVLEAVSDRRGDLESPTCWEAIAAAEAVAAALGHPSPGAPEPLVAWTRRHGDVPADLVALARRALAAIIADSELCRSWQRAGRFDDWRLAMRDLEVRLPTTSR